MKDLIEKLAEVMAKQKQAESDLEAIQANKDKLQLEIKELEAKIEEAKKPKLRHGDYGYLDGIKSRCQRCVFIDTESNGTIQAFNEPCSMGAYVKDGCSDRENIILGNIFDDLKAMQEDKTEFEIKDTYKDDIVFSIYNNRFYVGNKENAGRWSFPIGDLDTISNNLRQMYHTAKRRQK